MSKPTEHFNLWNCDFNINFVSLKGSRIILETNSHIHLWGYFQALVNWTWMIHPKSVSRHFIVFDLR